MPGINYYLLKQIDIDDSYTFSKTISIRFDAQVKIRVYPNPVTDVLRIESSAELRSFEIFGVDGARLTGISIPVGNPSTAASGTHLREINLGGQKPRIYVLIVDGISF